MARELDADRIAHPNETSTHCEAANIEASAEAWAKTLKLSPRRGVRQSLPACESGASVVVIALREYLVR